MITSRKPWGDFLFLIAKKKKNEAKEKVRQNKGNEKSSQIPKLTICT